MKNYFSSSPLRLFPFSPFLLLASLACGLFNTPTSTSTPPPPNTPTASFTPAPPTSTPTPLPTALVQPGAENPDEPVFITGDIPYTSPFFVNTLNDPLVLLEDQAGFVARDFEFEFKLEGQVIGPVEVLEDDSVV